MTKKSIVSLSALAAALSATMVAPAFAEGTSIKSKTGKSEVVFYGQINRGILFADNGTEDEVFFVDNDNSSTRFGFEAKHSAGALSFGAKLELQVESNSTGGGIDFGNTNGSLGISERVADLYVSGAFGKIFLGQGSSASDGSSEADLSGTGVVAYSGIGDLAGTLSFNNSGGFGVTVGDVFSNFDGLGRNDRLRYESPSFGGFTFGASIASDDAFDIAANWAGEFDGFEVAAAASYVDPGDASGVDEQYSASASILLDNGLNFTVAGGEQELAAGGPNPTFGYVKAGYQADIFSVGKTAFSVDYYEGDDVGFAGTESTSYGIAAVQKFDDLGLEAYAAFRNYEFDSAANDDDLTAVLLGARLKF
ncbi:hypothetical protein ACMU_17905 [Actibacterium mucosum KCTC 23349]|uniref:Porin domain-containing protein n=1 Tax=Actibacterium mucosum KCTC 23349 TaxID=1454373 RepID=A0A037ZGC0_9RHOB|nr:porin [Actibacterium mucosum]KAJ54581.1 hypothetical protein ACMU_17905 [Actibacterium mucosum KCTC 23349]